VLVLRDGRIVHEVDGRQIEEAKLMAMALGEEWADV
jgi:ABC-type sugar transport system ATPase subunit